MHSIEQSGVRALVPVHDDPLDTEPPAQLYLDSVATGSRRAMKGALNVVAELLTGGKGTYLSCPWWLVRHTHTSAVKQCLQARYQPATVNKHLSALRGVLKMTWQLGLMGERDWMAASDVRSVTVSAPVSKRTITSKQIAKLFTACEGDGLSGCRDAAILALLYGCGLRRHELVKLSLDDYDSQIPAILVREGRGGEERVVYPPPGTERALEAWLDHRGDDPGPLLVRVRRGGHIQLGCGLTDHAVLLITRKRAEQAGVSGLTPSDLRHAFIADMLDLGSPVTAVQKLAGHRSAGSTLRYSGSGEKAKLDAARKLMVPYGAESD